MSELLSAETRGPLLDPLLAQGWAMAEGRDALVKTFEFADFASAIGWMMQVAIWAEKWDHHPSWRNSYRTVHVELTTHDVGGLSALDAKLARKMDKLVER